MGQVCTRERKLQLLGGIRAHLAALKRTTVGKHICMRVEKLLDATRMQEVERKVRPHMLFMDPFI